MLFSDFTYNDITFKRIVRTSGYKAEFVDSSMVGIRDTITSLPGVDGVERYTSYYKDRLHEIRGFALGNSEADLYTKIAALEKAFDIRDLESKYEDGFAPLVFQNPGQGQSLYYCKPIRRTLKVVDKRTGLSRPFSVLLESRDPNKYEVSKVDVVYTITPSDGVGTSIFPFALPVELSSESFVGATTIENTGDGGIWPVHIRIYGPCSGPIVENITSGEHISFVNELTIASGEYLEVIPQYGTCFVVNGGTSTNVLQHLTNQSKFWKFASGNNTIRYRAGSMTAGSKCEIKTRFTL